LRTHLQPTVFRAVTQKAKGSPLLCPLCSAAIQQALPFASPATEKNFGERKRGAERSGRAGKATEICCPLKGTSSSCADLKICSSGLHLGKVLALSSSFWGAGRNWSYPPVLISASSSFDVTVPSLSLPSALPSGRKAQTWRHAWESAVQMMRDVNMITLGRANCELDSSLGNQGFFAKDNSIEFVLMLCTDTSRDVCNVIALTF